MIWPGVISFANNAPIFNGLLSFVFYTIISCVILFLFHLIFIAPYQLASELYMDLQAQKDNVERLENELSPTLRLFFDDSEPYFLIELLPGEPPRFVTAVSVENIGGVYLDQIQVRVKYNITGKNLHSYMSQKYARNISCPPFALVPDDSKPVHILWAVDPECITDEDQNYLSLFCFSETKNGWEKSVGVPILTRNGRYDMTIEALSANTRRASINLIIMFENNKWVIRNA